jgi:hypothetical protein
MTAVAFRAFPSSFLSTAVATGLAIANSVAVAGCANGVEVFPGNQVVGPSGAAAGSGSTLGSGGASFGAGVSAGASGTVETSGTTIGGSSGPLTDLADGGVPGASFGPQPNADFSNCGVPDPSGSENIDAGIFLPGPGPLPGLEVPTFGPTITATTPPPPISGGTLIGLQTGSIAVASDPDRDALYIVDTSGAALLKTIVLQAGDEPGRLVEDGAGRVHVALRSGGALVTVDPTSGTLLARRAACPAPRGVAWDSTTDLVWVACATGELVALPAAGGPIAKQWVIERDLRDVIIRNGAIAVTEFRSAQILRLNADGSIARRDTIVPNGLTTPQVAWRAVESSTHGMLLAHQDDSTVSIPTHSTTGAYGISGGVVGASCALVDDSSGAEDSTVSLSNGVLPVDIAISPDDNDVVVALAGNGFSNSAPELQVIPINTFGPPAAGIPVVTSSGAFSAPGGDVDAGIVFEEGGVSPPLPAFTPEELTAVAFDSAGRLLVQSREPAVLHILDLQTVGTALTNPLGGTQVVLSTNSRDDTGHDIFHATAGAPIACASCHPEGGDDGHVWILDGFARKTPSLRGTIAGTAPYHWPGDERDFPTLANDVYTGRMEGQELTSQQTAALSDWVNSIPAPPSPSWVDPSAASRGKVVFEGPTAGCSVCHSGPKLTNNMTMNVGTCDAFQVPPLVGVGWRAPLMHNGCAATLADRFGKCSTAGHGSGQALSVQEISDLTAYLESL